MVTEADDGTIGYDGRPRRETRMLCTNPITGIPDTEAPAEANIGTLKPEGGFKAGQLVAGQVGAKCDDARGFLMIGEAEAVEQFGTEERSVGKEWGRTCRSRWSPVH